MDTASLYDVFCSCAGVTTDSRSINGGELFFALKGENFDGNEYALKALEAGASYAVVEEGSRYSGTDSRIISVPDTLAALKALAHHHRENCLVKGKRLTVIGLTGTNGKTTTKELIREVLSRKYRVTATKGNLNNDIGVPLSLLSIGDDTELAVIEMGANHPDDIAKLVEVADPDYGLITNVGKAHLLGFGSLEGVMAAKGRLYDHIAAHGKAVFLNVNDPLLTEMAAARPGLATIPYGIEYGDVKILPSDALHPFLRMSIPSEEGKGARIEVGTSLVGAYNACNVLAAITVGRYFGISAKEAAAAVSAYVPANNRSQMVRSGRNTLIVDAYNANPSSMAAALDNFAAVQAEHKVALLGDMRELGEESLKEHVAIVTKLRGMDVETICLVGEEFGKALGNSPLEGAKHFADSDELAQWLHSASLEGCVVLVKGSRGIRMEKVIPEL